MPKPIKSLDRIRINAFDAIKRAFIKQGIVPGAHYVKKSPSGSKTESNSVIEDGSERTDKKPGIKKSSIESEVAKGPESLTELTRKSHEIIYEATTVFPFDLVPDTIVLDREKLTTANRFFWRVATITSVPIGEIMSAEANVGPFFGSLHLTFRFFVNNERTVRFLWRRDAIEMQRLIHGFIVAHRREIDTTKVPIDKLKQLLYDLGQGVSD